jgi:cysteinyl-tRNA synthetase
MAADYVQRISDAFDDDLDTPTAVVALGELEKDDAVTAGSKFETFAWADRLLGLDLARDVGRPPVVVTLPDAAQGLLDRRAAARAAKDWSVADALRDELAGLGVTVADGPEGQTWSVT